MYNRYISYSKATFLKNYHLKRKVNDVFRLGAGARLYFDEVNFFAFNYLYDVTNKRQLFILKPPLKDRFYTRFYCSGSSCRQWSVVLIIIKTKRYTARKQSFGILFKFMSSIEDRLRSWINWWQHRLGMFLDPQPRRMLKVGSVIGFRKLH